MGYIRGPIEGYISPYFNYYPTVTEGGAVPSKEGLGFGGLGVWGVQGLGVSGFRGLGVVGV